MPEVQRRERPILFSGPMVRAILDGRKTQTRRLVRVPECVAVYEEDCEPHEDRWWYTSIAEHPEKRGEFWAWMTEYPDDLHVMLKCPYGVIGDRLWVKETFALSMRDPADEESACTTEPQWWDAPVYAADGPSGEWERGGERIAPPWRPSIFMSRWASRITLEIVSIRAERLQAITEEDARAEGAPVGELVPARIVVTGLDGKTTSSVGKSIDFSARGAFCHLWDGINGKRADWKSNPWVWVVEFKRAA